MQNDTDLYRSQWVKNCGRIQTLHTEIQNLEHSPVLMVVADGPGRILCYRNCNHLDDYTGKNITDRQYFDHLNSPHRR